MNPDQEKVFEAAKHGTLNQLAPKLLTQENLTIKKYNEGTPFHWTAYSGALDQIPRELLTQENLTIKNGDEDTPLHNAAYAGDLDKIPREFLTQENLTIKDRYGSTPFHNAAYKGDLNKIPEQFRPAAKNIGQISDLTSGTMTNLLRKVPTKESLEILIQCSHNQYEKDFLQKGLNTLKKMEASRQKLSDAITEISNPQIS